MGLVQVLAPGFCSPWVLLGTDGQAMPMLSCSSGSIHELCGATAMLRREAWLNTQPLGFPP